MSALENPATAVPARAPAQTTPNDARPLLAVLAQCPSSPRRAAIREQLVRLHMPLVQHLAKRLARRPDEIPDLTQVGVIGLLNAIDRFDASRGFEFTTFAVPTITGEIRRHVRDTGWLLHVPRRAKELQRQIRTARDTLIQQLRREPSAGEIADLLGIPEAHVREATTVAATQSSVSVDTADDIPSLAHRLSAGEHGYDQVEQRAVLLPALAALPEREREVLMLRFMTNRTQTEIARMIGVSQMQVSRLMTRALDHMRDLLADADLDARAIA